MYRWLAVCCFVTVIGHVTSTDCTVYWNQTKHNTHQPSYPDDRNDTEPMPDKSTLDKFCPPGSSNLRVQCIDDADEGFTGLKSDAAIDATCTLTDGMHCTPKPGGNDTCPDMSLQIGCCRPATTVSPNQPKGTQVPSAVTMNPSGSGTSQNGVTGSANDLTTPSRSASGSGAQLSSNGQDSDNGTEATGRSIFLLLSACLMLFVLI